MAAQLPGHESGLLGLTEFHAPYGVPDLTVVVGDSSPRKRRLRLAVPPLLNEVDAGIVSAVSSRRPTSVHQIAAQLGWSTATIGRRLPGVVRGGALLEQSTGRYLRPEELVPVGATWAIETKVEEWRRALLQCRTYRTWADGYVLIMGRVPPPALDELRREVQNDRGGLVVGERWVVRPARANLKASRRLWTSEHVIAARKKPKSNPLP